MLTNLSVVIILQYIQTSNCYAVHSKLTQCNMLIESQWHWEAGSTIKSTGEILVKLEMEELKLK